MRRRPGFVLTGFVLLFAGCGRPREPAHPIASVPSAQATPATPLSARAELGRRLFFDPQLSSSGRQSCASCHDPAHAYAPANNFAVQLGGADLKTPGTRAVPTLMYKKYTRAYSDAYENPDQRSRPAPGGGFGWDGRTNSLAEQAVIPLLAANEMANVSRAAVVAKVRKADYAAKFVDVFGAADLGDDERALAKIGSALQAFQTEDRSFHPSSSKFDRYRGNKLGGRLSEQEQRGFALYMAPDKGNCNACHLLGAGNDGSQDISSDYSYAALGVPRNSEIPANTDPAYFDLGLCGPLRSDHATVLANAANPACGLFKTPVLRNVATRQVFMHNGAFKSLREVVRFYAARDTRPELWYPHDAAGEVHKFDDLPLAYRGNLDLQAPLNGRAAGAADALTDEEIDAIAAFLETLTDEPFAASSPRADVRNPSREQAP